MLGQAPFGISWAPCGNFALVHKVLLSSPQWQNSSSTTSTPIINLQNASEKSDNSEQSKLLWKMINMETSAELSSSPFVTDGQNKKMDITSLPHPCKKKKS